MMDEKKEEVKERVDEDINIEPCDSISQVGSTGHAKSSHSQSDSILSLSVRAEMLERKRVMQRRKVELQMMADQEEYESKQRKRRMEIMQAELQFEEQQLNLQRDLATAKASAGLYGEFRTVDSWYPKSPTPPPSLIPASTETSAHNTGLPDSMTSRHDKSPTPPPSFIPPTMESPAPNRGQSPGMNNRFMMDRPVSMMGNYGASASGMVGLHSQLPMTKGPTHMYNGPSEAIGPRRQPTMMTHPEV